MVVYTALALCRTYHELTSTPKSQLEAALRAAAQTLTYGPMLCVLFIAYRMRVEYLGNGKDEPQAWVHKCMYGLTLAVPTGALLVFVIQLVTGKPLPSKETPFDLESGEVGERYNKVTFYALTSVRYLVLYALYGGLAGVIVAICTYLPPSSQKPEAPSPAIMCTMILAIVFFSTQLIIAVCRSYLELTRVNFPQIVGMMHAASTTVEFAPMLAVLFLAASMRALQHDAKPQEWAHNCMFASTGAMCVTALLGIAVPLTLGGNLKRNPWTHEVVVEVPKPFIGYVFIALRYLCMLCFYGGTLGVIVSIVSFESPGGAGATLPVSPTVQCVINLTCQFFFVHFVLTVMLTVSEMTGGVIPMEKWSLFPAVEAARLTLAYAPILSMLFVTTEMYALLITDKTGAPPSWVQDGMYMATWSLQTSSLMCLATGLFMAKVETNYDGSVVNKFSKRKVGTLLVLLRYSSLLLMYGGMVMVIVGLFTITPGSANGRGSAVDVYSGTGASNAVPFASRPTRIAISTVHTLVQMGSL